MRGVVERTEAQRVHQRDRTRAHREDVADDAADAGGRALVGLDRGRVVVALDADRDREAVADVDHAGALARTDEHPRRLGGEPREVALRRLVRAVLRPHHRVHRELELGGLAAEQLDDRRELVVGEAQLPVEGLGRRHVSSAAARIVVERPFSRKLSAYRVVVQRLCESARSGDRTKSTGRRE